ncbi:MAG: calcium/proton exchanger [Omnitrophica WOR_2 bacterium]
MIVIFMLILIPVSLVLKYLLHAPAPWVFFSGLLALAPLAEWIRRSTEQLALHVGPAVGSLLNVTLGNIPELVLALFILRSGSSHVAKAQITGSLLGNSLFGLGIAILAGSFLQAQLKFDRNRAGLLSSLLFLAVMALMIPALFDYTERSLIHTQNLTVVEERLSLSVSVVLLLVYVANLVYTLYTHRDIFSAGTQDPPTWSIWTAMGALVASTLFVALESELISGALEASARQFGISPFFIGIILLALVGNIAEYFAAVYFARQNRMNVAMSITVGSTIQVALLIAPLLVILSYLLGTPMNLVFNNPLELVAIAGVCFAVAFISRDGETNWFEGVLLLAIYTLLAIAFFFLG